MLSSVSIITFKSSFSTSMVNMFNMTVANNIFLVSIIVFSDMQDKYHKSHCYLPDNAAEVKFLNKDAHITHVSKLIICRTSAKNDHCYEVCFSCDENLSGLA